MVFWCQRQRKTPLTMTISSVLPQLFGCRASVIPGLFVRPVLRPGPFPSFFGPACSIPRASGVACSEPWLPPPLSGKVCANRQLVGWHRLHQKCIKPASGKLGPVDTGKGAHNTRPPAGAVHDLQGRGPWPSVRLCVCSVGAGAVCPALQGGFIDPLCRRPGQDRRGL